MMHAKTLRLISVFGACLSFGPLVSSGLAQDRPHEPDASEGRVRFAPGVEIPPAPSGLGVFKLSPQKPPADFVRELLPSVAPESKDLQSLGDSAFFKEKYLKPRKEMLGAFQGRHLAILLDPKSGDVEAFPATALLKPAAIASRPDIERLARDRASGIFERGDVIGKDATHVAIGNLTSVYGATLEHKQGATARSELFLVYVPLRRYVESYPVYGLGSRALVAVGADGAVRGFLRRWKLASPEGKVAETPKPDEVRRSIVAQLAPLARNSEVVVRGVKLAYCDRNRDYLQPVYRFTAQIHHPGKQAPAARRGADDFVIGYTAIGKEFEPLPVLGKRSGAPPVFPKARPYAKAPKPGDPTVGRYVVRNDDEDWVDDANEFMDGLNNMPAFTDSQYFWAEPFEFIGDQSDFINHVELALNEVHGNWWGFSTTGNSGDWVDMTTIPAPGYGSAAGGSLAYWVIHSCEVLPSPDDTPKWADPWWNIFGGLHSVVSYRTIMWIDDDVGGPYGDSIAWFAPVVSGWLNEVAGADAYDDGDTSKTHNGRDEPMGRASTISACGTEDQAVYWSTLDIPAATCLRTFWFAD
jgi:hypothetical protein